MKEHGQLTNLWWPMLGLLVLERLFFGGETDCLLFGVTAETSSAIFESNSVCSLCVLLLLVTSLMDTFLRGDLLAVERTDWVSALLSEGLLLPR